MKKIVLILSLAFFVGCSQKADVDINSENFPDVNFRNYIIENFEINDDGKLSDFEINLITKINVKRKNIHSLKGIEFFYNLKTIFCFENQITELDVSQNKKLEWLWCEYNPLTTLDVSQNKKLKRLWCTNTDIQQEIYVWKGFQQSSVNVSADEYVELFEKE